MAQQFFIIDGYNFLHAAGMIPRSVGSETLRRARRHLLRFLENRLTLQERFNTTIVFDVHRSKDLVPPRESFAEMSIINAVYYPDADTCIEELIDTHSAAKQLVVVSSDHRLQRAARKRKATEIDSSDFFDYLRYRQFPPEKNGQNTDEEDEKERYLRGIDYPAEDLPEDIISPADSLVETDDLELWKKRIQELDEE